MSQVKDTQLLRNISLVLKELREATGKTQADVFEETNIHVARIETGRNNIRVSTLSSLCDYFGITLTEFFKKVEKIRSHKS